MTCTRLVLLILSTTSSSVSKMARQVTGPNISSCMHLWSSSRPEMMVGWMKYPLLSGLKYLQNVPQMFPPFPPKLNKITIFM